MITLPDAKLFIDGQSRDAEGGKTFDVIGPWTGTPVGKAADATADDVNRAIAAARAGRTLARLPCRCRRSFLKMKS